VVFVLPETLGKVKSNVRERINAIPDLVTKPMDTVLEGVSKLVSLQPVKAVTYIAEHAGDGAISFVNKQADITRRWVG